MIVSSTICKQNVYGYIMKKHLDIVGASGTRRRYSLHAKGFNSLWFDRRKDAEAWAKEHPYRKEGE